MIYLILTKSVSFCIATLFCYFSSYPYETIWPVCSEQLFHKTTDWEEVCIAISCTWCIGCTFYEILRRFKSNACDLASITSCICTKVCCFSWHFRLWKWRSIFLLTTKCKSFQHCLVLFEFYNLCRYKNELTKEDKADLNYLVERQRHKLVRWSPYLR